MKLKELFEQTIFKQAVKIILKESHKNELIVKHFFDNNEKSDIKKGSRFNYTLFQNTNKSISFEEFEELMEGYKANEIFELKKIYKSIFDIVINSQDENIDMTIVLKEIIEPTFKNKTYIDVYGLKNDEEHALEFHPWSEWSNMEISQETLDKFSPEEICAHCLAEMTVFGFSEKEIKEKSQLLNKILEDLERDFPND